MDVLAILKDKLSAAKRLYDGAVSSFVDTKQRIEAGKEPYKPPPFDPDRDDGEPPFLSEWLEANEFENVVGQACISVAYSCLIDYFKGVIERSGITHEADKFLNHRRNKVRGENTFQRYVALFEDAYSVDFKQAPVAPSEIQDIVLLRHDTHHGRPGMGLNRYQLDEHVRQFPNGLFLTDLERTLLAGDANPWVSLDVTPEKFQESVRRIEQFCEFVEKSVRQ
jgi:hypothetical protein